MVKTDEEVIRYFNDQGITQLPDGYRQRILVISQANPKLWYTPEIFSEGLGASVSYCYKICEQLVQHRVLERSKQGKTCYYRLKEKDDEPTTTS